MANRDKRWPKADPFDPCAYTANFYSYSNAPGHLDKRTNKATWSNDSADPRRYKNY